MRGARGGVWRWIVALALVGIVAGACGSGGGVQSSPAQTDAASPTAQVRVVVSLSVFVSMVQAVGGDRVSVTSIVPPGVDTHTYQPTPGNVRAIADASMVFINGLGLEEWLNPLIESAGGSRVPVYELTQGLKTIEATPGTDQAEGNPHLWLDPANAEAYARVIEQQLIERDPAGAAQYRQNADRFIGQIEAFDAWAKDQIQTIPPSRRKLVTFHDAYPYFAAHFGLELVGSVVENPAREPSPQDMAKLADEIRGQDVPAIFIEPQFNPKVADRLAQEAGVKTYLLYSDTPPAGQGYLEMMRLNIEHVVEGLRS